jgi:hypothetical protein
MSTQPATRSSKGWLTSLFLGAYLITAFAYLAYSLFTGAGLCGYLIDLQMRAFGWAGMKMSFLIGMMVILLPFGLIAWLFERVGLIKRGRPGAAGAHTQTTTVSQMPLGWKVVCSILLAPLLIAAVVYFIISQIDRSNQQMPIYQINVMNSESVPPDGAKFATITGKSQSKDGLAFEEGSSTLHTYVPFTGDHWDSSEPVRYFLYTPLKNHSGGTSQSIKDVWEGSPDEGLDCQLEKNALPVYASKEFERRGVIIASPYYVLHHSSFANGHVAAMGPEVYWTILIVALVICLLLFISLSLTRASMHRLASSRVAGRAET